MTMRYTLLHNRSAIDVQPASWIVYNIVGHGRRHRLVVFGAFFKVYTPNSIRFIRVFRADHRAYSIIIFVAQLFSLGDDNAKNRLLPLITFRFAFRLQTNITYAIIDVD